MASGSFEFSASGYLQGKIDWSSSSNGAVANSSNVTAILYARRTNSYTTKGQSWSGYVKVGTAQTNISFSSSVSVSSGWVEMARVTTTISHNNDGSGSATISGSVTGPSGTSLAGNTSSGSQNVTLDKIARYTSISSFTVNKRNETSFTFSWSTADTVDYVWYSTNNGSSWTGYDVSDGTSGSFTVSGLSANTTYTCKIRVRRKDSQLTTDSSAVSQTTYKVPTQSLSSKTETKITMSWSLDSTADYIWYSKDNGSNWTAVGSVDATSGSYTISSLTANTSYNIKTRVRRKASQTTYDTTASTQTTYNYPNITAVQTSELVIGNSQKLTLYNPLSRTVMIRMYQNNTSGTQLYTGSTSGTTITFIPTASTLYASIPNSTSGYCVYSVIYGSSTKTTGQYKYKIVGTENPTFTNFTYEDTNSTTTALTGNNQILVSGYSSVTATISTANKAVAKNSATMKTYKMTIGNQTTNPVNYSSSSNVSLSLSGVNNANISIYATDSRALSKSVTKTAMIKNYTDLIIKSASTVRSDNGVGQLVTLSFNGTYWNGNFGSVANSITQIKYYYKETTSSTWITGETELSATTSGSTWSGNATVKGDLGADGFNTAKAYNIRFQIKDALVTKTYDVILNAGTPAIAIYKNKVAIGAKYDTSIGTPFQLLTDSNLGNIKYFASYAGILIKFADARFTKMISLRLWGNGYGQNPFESIIQVYHYNSIGDWRNAKQVNVAGTLPTCKFMIVDNCVALYVPTPGEGSTLIADAYVADLNDSERKRAKISFEYYNSEPSGSNKQACTLISNYFNSNITWASGSVNNVNYNDYKYSGTFYMGSGCSNVPETDTSWWRLWVSGNGGGDILQIASKIGDDTKTYVRTSMNGTWGAWKKFVIYDNDNWQILREGRGASWVGGRASAIVRTTSATNSGSFYAITSSKTQDGSWEIGTLGNTLHFTYITDTNYSSSTNASTVNYQINTSGVLTNYLTSAKSYFGNSLFSNTSGTTGTVTLSETAANFNFLEIFYSKGDFYQSVKVLNPNGKVVSLIMGYRDTTNSLFQIQAPLVTISGTSITKTRSGLVNLSATQTSVLSENEVRIHHVMGWR